MSFIAGNPLNYPPNSKSSLRVYKSENAPTPSDLKNFNITDLWIQNREDGERGVYMLIATTPTEATWISLGDTTSSGIDNIITDNGEVVPNAAGAVSILGGASVSTEGTQNTLTINGEGGVTEYVVGPLGSAPYQTIQSAIDAIGNNGNAQIFVKPGQYLENLTFPDTINLTIISFGSLKGGSNVTIGGTHTVPIGGNLFFSNVNLTSTTHIFSSTENSSCNIFCANGSYLLNGTIFDLPNNNGNLTLFNISDEDATSNTILNATNAVAFLSIIDSNVGKGIATATFLWNLLIKNSVINTLIDFSGAATTTADFCKFLKTITFSQNRSGKFFSCSFETFSSPGITYNSTANTDVISCSINTTVGDAITGTGAGTLTLPGLSFENNNSIASTVTSSSGVLYSEAFKSDYTANSVLIGKGEKENIVATAGLANGQLVIGSTNNTPVAANLTAGNGVTITNAPGSVTIAATTSTSIQIFQRSKTFFNTTGSTTNPFLFGINRPTNTQGAQLASFSITPTVIGSRISIRAVIQGDSNTGDLPGVGIFKNGVTTALVSVRTISQSTGDVQSSVIDHEEITTSLTPLTFSIRGGPQLAGRTWMWNINSLGWTDGGAIQSWYEVTEYSS